MKSLITKIKYDNKTLTNSANFTKDYIGLGLGQSNAVEEKKIPLIVLGDGACC